MRATITVVLLAMILLPCLATAQADESDLVRLLDEEQERMRTLHEALRMRVVTLERTAKVVVAVAGAGSAISSFATTSQSAARDKLEEAVRVMSTPEPLGEPFPSVLRQLADVLEHPELNGPPDRLRERYFRILRPLEEHLLQEVRDSEATMQRLRGLAGQLSMAESSLRQMSATALRSAIEAHALVLQ